MHAVQHLPPISPEYSSNSPRRRVPPQANRPGPMFSSYRDRAAAEGDRLMLGASSLMAPLSSADQRHEGRRDQHFQRKRHEAEMK